jgi:uncharacterized protein YrrD
MRTTAELRGLGIVHPTEGHLLGRIQDVFFDARSGQITGFLIEQAGVSERRFLSASLVQSLGADAAMLKDEEASQETGTAPATTQGVSAHALAGRRVLSSAGTVLGKATDVLVDEETMTIGALLFSAGLLNRVLHGRTQVPFGMLTAVGADAIVVSEEYNPPSEDTVHTTSGN